MSVGSNVAGTVMVLGTLAFAASPGSACAKQELNEKPQCSVGNLQCVHHVIQKMERRYRKLASSCDHDAIFLLVYLRTTEKYLETAPTLGYEDTSSVTREDSLFADLYFRAFDAYHGGVGDVPWAWQIAFDAASSKSVSALGDAFLGINAHIQRDLPYTLYELSLRGQEVSKHDHDLVNVFLAQVDVAQEIIDELDPTYPLDDDPTLIPLWREIAWQNFVALRDAPDEATRAQVVAGIETTAAAFAMQFVQLFAYPPGSDSAERDAYCEAMH